MTAQKEWLVGTTTVGTRGEHVCHAGYVYARTARQALEIYKLNRPRSLSDLPDVRVMTKDEAPCVIEAPPA